MCVCARECVRVCSDCMHLVIVCRYRNKSLPYLLLHGLCVGLSLLPPLVDAKERSHVVHPLNEARASTQWDHSIVLGLVELGLMSVQLQRIWCGE